MATTKTAKKINSVGCVWMRARAHVFVCNVHVFVYLCEIKNTHNYIHINIQTYTNGHRNRNIY